MLGARIFIFQLRHFFPRAGEHDAELMGKPKIDSRAGDSRPAFELSGQSLAQSIRRDTDFLEQRLSDAVALVEERGQKMLVADFLMIKLRSDVLRGLERFLHLLGELVDSQCPSCLAAGSVPPLHHRLGDFGHGNVDASDDPRLGNGYAHDFGIDAWISPALRRVANAGPYDDWRLNG